MKENIFENEEEEKEEKLINLEENRNDSIQEEESEEISENKILKSPMLNEQLIDKSEPKKKELNDILKSSSTIDSVSFQIVDKYNIILSKNLYISKDFIFIFFLLISSALNFSYLYLPFFLLVFFFLFFIIQILQKR